MHRRSAFIHVLIVALSIPGFAQGPVGLADLPALAGARADRQRPTQLAALRPHLAELSQDYGLNSRVLDATIAKVAKLGDSLVPLLLDYLTPSDAGDEQLRNLAGNAARILAQLDPGSFVDPLLELAQSKNSTARGESIKLLGHTRAKRAEEFLAGAYAKLSRRDKLHALGAMQRLQSTALATAAAQQLTSKDYVTQSRSLDYLVAVRADRVVPAVLQAFQARLNERDVGQYVAYFDLTVKGDGAVAEALLPLLEPARRSRLDLRTERRLCSSLGHIAPVGHAATKAALRAILESGDTTTPAIRAAVSLSALGDKKSDRILFENLDRRVRIDRGNPDGYASRASAYQAFGRWKKATNDYEAAIKHANVASERRLFYIQIAHCEAHRGNARSMLRALKSAGIQLEALRAEAARNPALAELLKRDAGRRGMRELEKDGR